jgi:hypothetical protein
MLLPGSSTVERSAVNRNVASSNLARGANSLNDLRGATLQKNCTKSSVLTHTGLLMEGLNFKMCYKNLR